MAINEMGFSQLATVLNSIVSQATGVQQITPTNSNEFVAVAQIGLKTGYDVLLNSISQVLSKTIFSVRPYSAKFKGMEMDAVRYGNHVRKLQMIDNQWEEDDRIKLTDNTSCDPYVTKFPKVLETGWYGESVVQDHLTIFKDQLDTAFSGPEEFGSFISMVMQNMTDRIEQKKESLSRATIANFIAAKSVADGSNCIYLLDKYEDETGLTGLTADTIKQPENFVPFAKWLFGYLKTVSDLMSERSAKYHMNPTLGGVQKNIMRHTPIGKQKIYLYAKEMNNIDASVLSSTFHDDYLKIADYQPVSYWQSIDTPMGISCKPSYVDTDGTVHANPSNVVMSNVFGLIADEEALGYTVVNEWMAPSPFNPRGGFTNFFWHSTYRYFSDLFESAVVLILDHSSNALKTLTVTPAAGTEAGKTAITISPAKAVGNTYCYKLGAAAVDVTYGKNVTDFTAWNGTDEIAASAGQVITVVEENALHRAVGAGSATVVLPEMLTKKK